jgi:hypothetical protein
LWNGGHKLWSNQLEAYTTRRFYLEIIQERSLAPVRGANDLNLISRPERNALNCPASAGMGVGFGRREVIVRGPIRQYVTADNKLKVGKTVVLVEILNADIVPARLAFEMRERCAFL